MKRYLLGGLLGAGFGAAIVHATPEESAYSRGFIEGTAFERGRVEGLRQAQVVIDRDLKSGRCSCKADAPDGGAPK